MRKTLLISALVGLAFMGYLITSPFITVSQIKAAVRDRNSQKLCNKIDFPLLRHNLKSQFKAKIVEEAGTDVDGGSYALALATTFADGIFEVFITPEGVSALMESEEFPMGRPEADLQGTFKSFNELFKESRFSFNSINSFSVVASNDVKEEIEFVFRRYGLNWKLCNVIVPDLEKGILAKNNSELKTKFGTDHLSLCPEQIWHSIKMGGSSVRSSDGNRDFAEKDSGGKERG